MELPENIGKYRPLKPRNPPMRFLEPSELECINTDISLVEHELERLKQGLDQYGVGNSLIENPDWIQPTTLVGIFPLDNPKGEYSYFTQIKEMLKKLKEQEAVYGDDEAFLAMVRAPRRYRPNNNPQADRGVCNL